MALTQSRRLELAKELEVAATWLTHRGRAGRILAIAAELRGEDPDDTLTETDEQKAKRLEAAEKAEKEAAEAASKEKAKTTGTRQS